MNIIILLKKVVFNISVLPVVKIISAMFVHGFFVLFTIILYMCYGRFPDLYYIQILYYSICTFLLVLGLVYATCAVVVFFRDLTQIISIGLQVGISADTDYVDCGNFSSGTSPSSEGASVKSDVLYCIWLQRCFCYEKVGFLKHQCGHL